MVDGGTYSLITLVDSHLLLLCLATPHYCHTSTNIAHIPMASHSVNNVRLHTDMRSVENGFKLQV